MEIAAGELELEVEPGDVTELLKSQDETFSRWGVASYAWAKNVVSWDGVYSWRRCCDDSWNDKKDLKYYVNFTVKEVSGFERIDSNSERSSTVSQVLSNTLTYYREIVKGRVNQWDKLHCLKKLQQTPQPSATTILISQQPSIRKQDSSPAKRLCLTEGSDDG